MLTFSRETSLPAVVPRRRSSSSQAWAARVSPAHSPFLVLTLPPPTLTCICTRTCCARLAPSVDKAGLLSSGRCWLLLPGIGGPGTWPMEHGWPSAPGVPEELLSQVTERRGAGNSLSGLLTGVPAAALALPLTVRGSSGCFSCSPGVRFK